MTNTLTMPPMKSSALSAEIIHKLIAEELPGWSLEKDRLTKLFEFKDFSEALGFIVRVGAAAEKLDHHPELFNVYSRVRLALYTHDAGNKVTKRDIDLARAIERLL